MLGTSNALAEEQLIKHDEKHNDTVSQKENDNSPETKLKVMKYCHLTDGEFKIAVMEKLSELQQDLEEQFNEFRNKINKDKEYFTKEVETLKKNQSKIQDLKNSINDVKNILGGTGNRANHMEKRISKVEDRNLEMIQGEEERELRSRRRKR